MATTSEVLDSRARRVLECLEVEDLSTKAGKLALRHAVSEIDSLGFVELRDKYRQVDRLSVPDANRRAAMDLVESIGKVDSAAGTEKVGDQLSGLVLAVRRQEKAGGSRSGIAQSVAWVSANVLTPLGAIEPADVPGSEALSLWNWARRNETEYRRLYDCKRIPTRGIAEDEEKGWVDDGSPIADILARIGEGVGRIGDAVSVRDLPAGKSERDDSGRTGGVHGVPDSSVEGGGGAGARRPEGVGGDAGSGLGGSDRGDGDQAAGEAEAAA